MQFCNLKNKKTNKKTLKFLPKLGAFNCFGGQTFQTRPNFIDLGALVCDSYPSIHMKIDQQIQAQVLYVSACGLVEQCRTPVH